MWLSMGFPVEGPQARDGAWLVEITNQLDLAKWPADCRVGVRGERPHPGAQMRFTDSNGHRFTAFCGTSWNSPGLASRNSPWGPLLQVSQA